jgi:hypothetical protein
MADYFWPTSLVPSATEWRLVANTAAFVSPLTGSTRTIARGGDRWACTLTFNNLTGANKAILQAFLAQLRGQANRVYVKDHSHRKRGVFPTSNLLPDFSSTTPWTEVFATLTVSDGIGRITALAHTGAQPVEISKSSISVTSGAVYAIRAHYVRTSTGTASVGPYVSDSGGSASSWSTAVGLKTAGYVMTASTASAVIVADSSHTSMATGDFADVSYVSLSRCMRVAVASQTGSTLAVEGTHAAGDLLAGDLIECNGELNMVADTFNGASGTGTIRFVRPMRSSPAIYTPVIIHDPACKMILANNTVGWSNIPGGFSSMSVELIEDIAS